MTIWIGLLILTLPDASSIRYTYDECFLGKIERFDTHKQTSLYM